MFMATNITLRRQNSFEDLKRIFRFLVIQVRCGKRQDTISDSGVHNTRLIRHNRCGSIDSKCLVEKLVGTSKRFDVPRHCQLVDQE